MNIQPAEVIRYYPVPNASNAALYKQYAELAAATEGVHFVGRLAIYKYYNMDQVVGQAPTLVKQLTASYSTRQSTSANGHSWSTHAMTA
jgi:UDP-galactopyranose mutase